MVGISFFVVFFIFAFWTSYTTGATGRAETGYPSEALGFIPIFSGVRIA
jgi:hypothetical protein